MLKTQAKRKSKQIKKSHPNYCYAERILSITIQSLIRHSSLFVLTFQGWCVDQVLWIDAWGDCRWCFASKYQRHGARGYS
jgi:hypothetical protein